MKKAGNGLIFLLALLIGCASVSKRPMDGEFDEAAYHYLVNEFTEKGLHNLDSPLFDFDDLEVKDSYNKTNTTNPEVISRDIKGRENIISEVEKQIKRYGDRNLIIISGAAFHIHGAISYLENNFNAEYISITPRKLIFDDFLVYNNKSIKDPDKQAIEYAKKGLEDQLQRANGVVRNYGFSNLKDFVNQVSDFHKADNIVVGVEETGLHDRYTEKDFEKVYGVLGRFIENYEPNRILYLREGSFSPKSKAGKAFLKKAERKGIPVTLNSFVSIWD